MKGKFFTITMIIWPAFLVGIIVAVKGFEPRLEYEVCKWWEKIQAIFIFAFSIGIGYLAGREN